MTDATEQKISEIHSDMTEVKKTVAGIEQLLKGYDGQTGVVKQVENHGKQLNKIWLILAVLIPASGGGGFGLFKIYELVKSLTGG